MRHIEFFDLKSKKSEMKKEIIKSNIEGRLKLMKNLDDYVLTITEGIK